MAKTPDEVPPAGRVLVVDDDDDIRLLVRTVLESAGYEVLEQSGGRSGLEAAESGVDLILLDLRMPDLGAWDFLARSWDRRSVRSVPVVLVSGMAEPIDVERAEAWGCAAYLQKPFTKDQLLSTVRRVLGQQQGQSSQQDQSQAGA